MPTHNIVDHIQIQNIIHANKMFPNNLWEDTTPAFHCTLVDIPIQDTLLCIVITMHHTHIVCDVGWPMHCCYPHNPLAMLLPKGPIWIVVMIWNSFGQRQGECFCCVFFVKWDRIMKSAWILVVLCIYQSINVQCCCANNLENWFTEDSFRDGTALRSHNIPKTPLQPIKKHFILWILEIQNKLRQFVSYLIQWRHHTSTRCGTAHTTPLSTIRICLAENAIEILW